MDMILLVWKDDVCFIIRQFIMKSKVVNIYFIFVYGDCYDYYLNSLKS